MTFTLAPVGGLCNRVQATFAYLSVHGEIDVFWDHAIPHWRETFVDVPGVRFIEDGSHVNARDHGIPAEAPHDWRKLYATLKPLPSIAERVAAFQESLNRDYIAIHVRRTDLTPLAARVGSIQTTDEEYHAFMASHPGKRCWIAADNYESQAKFGAFDNPMRHIGAVLAGKETVRDEGDHPVNGGPVDAVVDLLMCVGATHWLGCGQLGTFTGTISILRSLANGVVPAGYPWPK